MLVENLDDGMPPMVDQLPDGGPPPLVDHQIVTAAWNPDDFWNNEVVGVDAYQSATLSSDQTRFEVIEEYVSITGSPPPWYEEPQSAEDALPRSSHNKKRDASYIPRPPNAFILFRSSFIRSNQIPGKIEGNHSSLSKIVGKVWAKLPREERKFWEEKAAQAQVEHRKRYPDWRFRPSANAAAKLLSKVKDGPPRKNRPRGKEPKPSAASRTATPYTRKTRNLIKREVDQYSQGLPSTEARCAKIAELLDQGVKGAALIDAVQEWDTSNASNLQHASPPRSAEIDVKVGSIIGTEFVWPMDSVNANYQAGLAAHLLAPHTATRVENPNIFATESETRYIAFSPTPSPTPELSLSPTVSEASTAPCDHALTFPGSVMAHYELSSARHHDAWYNLFPSSYDKTFQPSPDDIVNGGNFCNAFPAVYSPYSSLQGWAGEPAQRRATWAN